MGNTPYTKSRNIEKMKELGVAPGDPETKTIRNRKRRSNSQGKSKSPKTIENINRLDLHIDKVIMELDSSQSDVHIKYKNSCSDQMNHLIQSTYKNSDRFSRGYIEQIKSAVLAECKGEFKRNASNELKQAYERKYTKLKQKLKSQYEEQLLKMKSEYEAKLSSIFQVDCL